MEAGVLGAREVEIENADDQGVRLDDRQHLLGAQDGLVGAVAANTGIDDRRAEHPFEIGRPAVVVVDLPPFGEGIADHEDMAGANFRFRPVAPYAVLERGVTRAGETGLRHPAENRIDLGMAAEAVGDDVALAPLLPSQHRKACRGAKAELDDSEGDRDGREEQEKICPASPRWVGITAQPAVHLARIHRLGFLSSFGKAARFFGHNRGKTRKSARGCEPVISKAPSGASQAWPLRL